MYNFKIRVRQTGGAWLWVHADTEQPGLLLAEEQPGLAPGPARKGYLSQPTEGHVTGPGEPCRLPEAQCALWRPHGPRLPHKQRN